MGDKDEERERWDERATEAASAKGEGRGCPEGPGRSAEKGFKMTSALLSGERCFSFTMEEAA